MYGKPYRSRVMSVSVMMLGVLCLCGLCVYVNTWFAFNAYRLIRSGIGKFSRFDLLWLSAVIACNGILWWLMSDPLLAALVWLPAIAGFLVDLRHRGAAD